MLGDGQVGLDAADGIEKLDLGAAFDETVGDFEFRLELPGRDTFFLDGQELRERDIGLDRFGGADTDERYSTLAPNHSSLTLTHSTTQPDGWIKTNPLL